MKKFLITKVNCIFKIWNQLYKMTEGPIPNRNNSLIEFMNLRIKP